MGNASLKQFIEGNWSQIRQKLKKKYPNLTDCDLQYSDGSEKSLMERLQVRLNMEEKELLKELRKLITR